jgi:hypothetical protein
MKLYDVLKEDWNLTRKTLIELGLNPNKNWEDVTVNELGTIADHLEVRIADLFD